jgi:hypothetical protein
MDQDVKYRIDSTQAIFLYSFALLSDLIQLILNLTGAGIVVTWLLNPFLILIFFTWFSLNKIRFSKADKESMRALASLVGWFLIKFIPIINIIFGFIGWTLSVHRTIKFSRRQDLAAAAGRQTGKTGKPGQARRTTAKGPGPGRAAKPLSDIRTDQKSSAGSPPPAPPTEPSPAMPGEPARTSGENVRKVSDSAARTPKTRPVTENGDSSADRAPDEGVLEDIVMEPEEEPHLMDPYREPVELPRSNRPAPTRPPRSEEEETPESFDESAA